MADTKQNKTLTIVLCIFSFILLLLPSCQSSTINSGDNTIHASGFIEAKTYNLRSQQNGTVNSLNVSLGNAVKQGDLILSLSTSGVDSAIDQAQAAVNAAQAEEVRLEEKPTILDTAYVDTSLAEAKAQVDRLESEIELLKIQYQPDDPPEADMKSLQDALEVAEANVKLSEAQLNQILVEPSEAEFKMVEAKIDEAQANLMLAEYQKTLLEIHAPVDGTVTDILINEGESVSIGQTTTQITDVNHLYIIVYISESQIPLLNIGDKVIIQADTYPGESFQGEIQTIASEAQFTPSSVQTTEERVKLVFAVKIAIHDSSARLKPGMPADVIIDK